MLTIFHFKCTYLAKVEVYLRVRSGWVLSLLHFRQPETSKKRLQIQELAHWQSFPCRLTKFLPNKAMANKNPPIRRTKTKIWWVAALVTWNDAAVFPYLVMDLSVIAFLVPTSQTPSIICYVTFLHITDQSAVLNMYHTSPPVLKVREKINHWAACRLMLTQVCLSERSIYKTSRSKSRQVPAFSRHLLLL